MANPHAFDQLLRKGFWRACLAGALAITLIAIIRNALGDYVGDRAPFVIFLLATAVSAWLGGFAPGFLTTAAGGLVGIWLFSPPFYSFRLDVPLDYFLLTLYLLIGIVIAVVCELLHRSKARAEYNFQARSLSDAKIRESERHLREILDMMPHLVWSARDNGEVDYLNKRWLEIVNVSLEEIKHSGWERLIHSDEQERVIKAWTDAKREGQPFSIDYRLKMADGSWRWHQGRIIPMRIGSGQIVKWIGTAIDIDDSRIAVEVLRASEERFRWLADSSPILIWISDAEKEFIWFNKFWLQFTGYTTQEEIRHHWADTIHPDDQQSWREVYERKFDARRPFEMEYRVRRNDGEYRWLLDRGTPIYEAGGVFGGYIGGCIDITERKNSETQSKKRLNAERAAREETERIGRMKDEFLATLSHEMRTPLNAILGWASLLRRGAVTDDHMPQAIETIERNARAQSQLIEDLLDMSRILSGKLRLEVKEVCLLKTATQVLDTLKPAIDARKIEIQMEQDQTEYPILGDPNRLQQVIWNLLSNAIKFTPTGGKVTVGMIRKDSTIEIQITDTGKGIPPEFLPFVFDRFRQLDSSSTRSHSGLGIGLSIVKQLVELHGGTVRAASKGQNTGSTFTIHLPVAAVWQDTNQETPSNYPPPPKADTESTHPSPLQGLDVLVVDDDADACELMREVMKTSGASVRTAGSALVAMEAFKIKPPDLLISDIGMPEEDGCSLIRHIRELPPEKGGKVPAIALTAFTRSYDKRRILLSGYQIHLPKPVDPQEVISVASRLTSA